MSVAVNAIPGPGGSSSEYGTRGLSGSSRDATYSFCTPLPDTLLPLAAAFPNTYVPVFTHEVALPVGTVHADGKDSVTTMLLVTAPPSV